MKDLSCIVLAAGQGTRMKSSLPKVLHQMAGRPLIYYPLCAAEQLGVRHIVVVTSPANTEAVRAECERLVPEVELSFCEQDPPQGTGHAAQVGMVPVQSERVLILYGDTPLLRVEDLAALVQGVEQGCTLALMSCDVPDPTGYGRILRDANGSVTEIREHKDLKTDAERAVQEVNAGVYAGETALVRQALERLSNDNAQGEYYLTDIVADLAKYHAVSAVKGDIEGLLGVNDRTQLHEAEQIQFARTLRLLGKSGVGVHGNVLVDTGVKVAPGAILEDGVRLRGNTEVGAGTRVDVGCVITDSRVANDAYLKPYSVVTESEVGDGAQIGPFAHLRPGSVIEGDAHIGNFVETKKTIVRRGAKANHLAYLGDGDVGERANIGAGTIFCNYDGYKKHRTVIGAESFIGSDSQLIAPVTLGKGAYVGTGTTVTDDIPDDGFAIGRSRQTTKPGYARDLKERLSKGAKKA